ncbi:zinc finger, CCHC-type containing protein [Tanacetum coccineum]
MPVKEAKTENGAENRIKNEPIKRDENEKVVEAPSSQPVGYYLKHRINEKLIERFVDNHRFNDSLSGVRVGKMKGKTYNLLPTRPVYEAILKKKITRKEDIGGNFEIPCNIGGLKRINALVDQGFDVNIMPLSTYMKLIDERPAKTDIRLSLASHSYIYPLRIAEDVLVDVVGYVYPMDFMILDIREDKKRPFILGTPFLTMAKVVIKFDKGTITLRSGKSKISFHRIPESLGKDEKWIKNDIEPIAPTMNVNRLILEWEERIKLHQEKEMEFDQWRSQNFKNKHLALVKVKGEKNKEEVTLGDSEPFNTLADLGSCVNIIPLYLFKKLNIGLLEETDHIFGLANGTKSYPIGIVKDVEVNIGNLKLLNDFYVIDMKKDLEPPLLVGRGFLATTNAVIDCRVAKIAGYSE